MNHTKIVFKNALEPKIFFISESAHLKVLTPKTIATIEKIDTLLTTEH
jgi:hypothetical protein